jgi:hypothetical protein
MTQEESKMTKTTAELETMIRELQKYLKKKLKPVDTGNGDIYWTCGKDHFGMDLADDPFSHLREFCDVKDLDADEVRDSIQRYCGETFICECNIVNRVKIQDVK